MGYVAAMPLCPFIIKPSQKTVTVNNRYVNRLDDESIVCAPGAQWTPVPMSMCNPTVLVEGKPIACRIPDNNQKTVSSG